MAKVDRPEMNATSDIVWVVVFSADQSKPLKPRLFTLFDSIPIDSEIAGRKLANNLQDGGIGKCHSVFDCS